MDYSIIWTVAWMAIILISVAIRRNNRIREAHKTLPQPSNTPDSGHEEAGQPPVVPHDYGVPPPPPYGQPATNQPTYSRQATRHETQQGSRQPNQSNYPRYSGTPMATATASAVPDTNRQKPSANAGKRPRLNAPTHEQNHSEREDIHQIVKEFDLEKAVIFSEILKPKYDQ